LSRALADIFHDLATSPYAVSTERLTTALNWGPVSRQQDVHEFWTLLCQRLEEEMKGSPQEPLVESLFQGRQRDYITCSCCGRTSSTHDAFQDLKPPVPYTDGASIAAVPTLHAALTELLLPEKMCGAEQYACDTCAKRVDAERGVELMKLPPLLALQLKRFRYDLKTHSRVKVNTPLAFPFTLDMRPFVANADAPTAGDHAVRPNAAMPPADACGMGDGTAAHMVVDSPAEASADDMAAGAVASNVLAGDAAAGGTVEGAARVEPCGHSAPHHDAQYELYGVLVHSGSATFGHYYALIKDMDAGEWHEFNDASVRPIKESELARAFGSGGSGGSAYLLLYRALDAPLEPPPLAAAATTRAAAVGAAAGSADEGGAKRLRLTPPLGASPLGASGAELAPPLPPDLDAMVASADAMDADDEDTNPYSSFG